MVRQVGHGAAPEPVSICRRAYPSVSPPRCPASSAPAGRWLRATSAAAGARLYCASAIRSQSPSAFDASTTSRSCSARSPRSSAASAPSASFGTSSTERGNSGGIEASVGGNVESRPILRPCADGLLDHRLVGLQHRHRRVRAGDRLDAGAERRAGEQDGVRTGADGVAAERQEALGHGLGQPAVARQIGRQAVVEQIHQPGLRPKLCEGRPRSERSSVSGRGSGRCASDRAWVGRGIGIGASRRRRSYLNGIAYIRPPLLQAALRPRSSFSGLALPTLRSKISP